MVLSVMMCLSDANKLSYLLTYLLTYDNNNNQDNAYGAVIMTKSHCIEFTRFMG